MFYGRSFMFDGISSELYGLHINDVSDGSLSKSVASSSQQIYEEKIYRRPTPYFFGSTPSPRLTFEFSAFSEQEIDANTFGLIAKWLTSPRSYKKFFVDQIDSQSWYANVIFNNIQANKSGHIIQGFSATIECNSPWTYSFPQTVDYTYDSSVVSDTIVFNNSSQDSGDYLYPTLTIITNTNGGNLKITNVEDNNRISIFTGLMPNEIVTINSDLQTIVSNSGLLRLGNFNKNFLRLVPNRNTLKIQGNVAVVSLTYQFASRSLVG